MAYRVIHDDQTPTQTKSEEPMRSDEQKSVGTERSENAPVLEVEADWRKRVRITVTHPVVAIVVVVAIVAIALAWLHAGEAVPSAEPATAAQLVGR